MPERIMTDEQLLELHNDIRDGVSMIVAVDHYYQLETKAKDLRTANEKLREALEEIAAGACKTHDCNAVKGIAKQALKKGE